MRYHKAINLARDAHKAFSRIHTLAQAIDEEAGSQREQAVEALIGIFDSSYAVQGLERLAESDSHIWHLQLALMWDYLPDCREAVLALCRVALAGVMGQLQKWLLHPELIRIEWVLERQQQMLVQFVREVGEAGILLGKEDLSSIDFVRGLAALAKVAMYTQSTEEIEVWQAEIQLYQRLYDVFFAAISDDGIEEQEHRRT
jgi:hypothetical protein